MENCDGIVVIAGLVNKSVRNKSRWNVCTLPRGKQPLFVLDVLKIELFVRATYPMATCCAAHIETFLSSNILRCRRRRLISSVSTFTKNGQTFGWHDNIYITRLADGYSIERHESELLLLLLLYYNDIAVIEKRVFTRWFVFEYCSEGLTTSSCNKSE